MTLDAWITRSSPASWVLQFLALSLTSGHLIRKPSLGTPPAPPPPQGGEDDSTQCELFGPLALVIQGTMGAFAIMTLVIKRSKESPQRPLWVWFFDVSKQVFGSLGLHVINLALSNLQSHSDEPDQDNNPCTWYFLNLLLDTTLGVPILWFFLYIIHMTAFRIGVTEIISGQYGDPPRWSAFIKQAGLYLVAMICMKSVLYSVTEMVPWLDSIGAFLLSWTNWSPELQVVFVILIFPLIMNTLQYYLIDTIIQSPEYHSYDEGPGDNKDQLSRRDEAEYGSIAPTCYDCRHGGYDFLGQREAAAESFAWHQRLLKASGIASIVSSAPQEECRHPNSLSSASSQTQTA